MMPWSRGDSKWGRTVISKKKTKTLPLSKCTIGLLHPARMSVGFRQFGCHYNISVFAYVGLHLKQFWPEQGCKSEIELQKKNVLTFGPHLREVVICGSVSTRNMQESESLYSAVTRVIPVIFGLSIRIPELICNSLILHGSITVWSSSIVDTLVQRVTLN